MTKTEISNAKKILDSYADRFDVAGVDGGGLCLTAHWVGGCQTVFYSLDAVQRWATARHDN